MIVHECIKKPESGKRGYKRKKSKFLWNQKEKKKKLKETQKDKENMRLSLV